MPLRDFVPFLLVVSMLDVDLDMHECHFMYRTLKHQRQTCTCRLWPPCPSLTCSSQLALGLQ